MEINNELVIALMSSEDRDCDILNERLTIGEVTVYDEDNDNVEICIREGDKISYARFRFHDLKRIVEGDQI